MTFEEKTAARIEAQATAVAFLLAVQLKGRTDRELDQLRELLTHPFEALHEPEVDPTSEQSRVRRELIASHLNEIFDKALGFSR